MTETSQVCWALHCVHFTDEEGNGGLKGESGSLFPLLPFYSCRGGLDCLGATPHRLWGRSHSPASSFAAAFPRRSFPASRFLSAPTEGWTQGRPGPAPSSSSGLQHSHITGLSMVCDLSLSLTPCAKPSALSSQSFLLSAI